jgi:uncharacterized protein
MGQPFRQAQDLTVSVRELYRQPGASRREQLAYQAGPGLGSAVISLVAGSQATVDLLLESVLEGVLATGTARALAEGECARCLAPVSLDLAADFSELYLYPERALAATETGAEDPDTPVVADESINLMVPVQDALVLALPFQPLCSDDCAGLCPTCGVLLGENPGHTHSQVDPRWLALEAMIEEKTKEESD